MSVRILLVDDHQIFADGLRAMLERQPRIEVVGQVPSGESALEAARNASAHVVLMDLSMPGMNGMEATSLIRTALPDVRVLCLSMHVEKRFVETALRAGASGYLLKVCALDELLRAIEVVAGGGVYLSPGIAGTVRDGCRTERLEHGPTAFSVLSGRERQVLQLLAEGHSTRAIASQLHLSGKTIASHRERLMQKVDIHSVAGLTKYAIREGLTTIAS